MKSILLTLTAAIFAMFTLTASAAPYIGVAMSEGASSNTAIQATVGATAGDYLGAEVAYVASNTTSFWEAALVGRMPVVGRLTAFGKVGGLEHGNHYLSLGLNVNMTSTWSTYIEAAKYTIDSSDDEVLRAGLRYSF